MSRMSVPSSSISATAYGTSGAKPGRNAWRMTVHVLTRPEPFTGSNRNRRAGSWQCTHTITGGWAARPHASQRWMASTWPAAADQKPADCSSGTGTGFGGAVSMAPSMADGAASGHIRCGRWRRRW